MKVTFIQPYYHNVWEALGIGYLISFLKKNYQGELDIKFFQGYFDSDEDILKGVFDEEDGIVFFSCTSPAYSHGLELANMIKRGSDKYHIVFGGWHPTALPDDVIAEECVDQVVVGEGETAVVRIVEGERQEIVRGGLVHPDNLPWPDRAAIRNIRTTDLCESVNGKRTASFQLNRGCKVHCAYCSEVKVTGRYNKNTNPIRTRNYMDVITEIEDVRAKYNIDYFKFVDATFDKDKQTVIDFCKAKSLMLNNLEWECNIHPGFVQDEEVFEYLSESNCKQINVGVESGSQKILNQIGKGTKIQHIINVFKWAKKHGIETRGYFILGMPDEQWEDYDLTDQLIEKIKPDYVGFTILCPYPGTDFYDPRLHKNIDWSKTDEYSNDFWRTKISTNETLKKVQHYFTEKYKNNLCERQAK